MVKEKNKTKIKRYYCYHCNCTGFFNKKQIIFQIWNWGYEFINKNLCKYCEGRGYIIFKHKYELLNNYKSYLDH